MDLNNPNKVIVLSKGILYEVLISPDDYHIVSKFKWWLKDNGYVYTQVNRKSLYLHRMLFNFPKGRVIDHINHNKLDNRRENLRVCTQSQNNMNRYNSLGVSKFKNKWRARIKLNKKEIHLGIFDSFEEALSVRKRFEVIMFKEYRLYGSK